MSKNSEQIVVFFRCEVPFRVLFSHLFCHIGMEVDFEDLKDDLTLSAIGDVSGAHGALSLQSE